MTSTHSTDRFVPVCVLIAAFVGGTLLLTISIHPDPVVGVSLHVPWPVIAAAFAAGHFALIRVDFRGQSHNIDLTDVVLLPAIVFVGGEWGVVAAAAGTLIRSVAGRRPVVKAVFNISLHAFAVAVALVCFHAVLGDSSVVSPAGWGAAVVAVVAAEATTHLGIQAVIGVTTGRLSVGGIQQMAVTLLIMVGVDGVLGLVAVHLLWSGWAGGVLFVAVAAFGCLGYTTYGRLRDRHHRLDQLYRFEQTLAGVADTGAVVEAVLQEAMTLLAGQVAQLVGTTDGTTRCHTLVRGSATVVSTPEEQPLRTLVTEERPGVLAPKDLTDGDVADALRRSGFRDAIVVRLPPEGVTEWVLVVGDRLGADYVTFAASDVALAEALATPAAMALRNSDLLDQLRTEVEIKHHQASHDSLTGLANRALFSSTVDRVLVERRRSTFVGILLIDLDGFKRLNDTLGHEAGDGFLRELALRISSVIGSAGTAARLGGDEFAVVLPEQTSVERAAVLADEIDRIVRSPVTLSGATVQLRASIGVAVAPLHGEDRFVLLRQADLAMYRAKQSGGGVCAQHDRFADSIDRFMLITALRSAVESGDLTLVYQPKVSFATGAVTGVEALLRWTHPLYGEISPSQFIPVAEASGLIRPMTTWVLQTALAQVATWQRAGIVLELAVNLSPEQVGDRELLGEVGRLLDHHGVPPAHLTLEITESGVVRDWGGDSQELLDGLTDMGVRLAIDDFGTGTSSLSRLKSVRVDELKIDKSFITDLTTDAADAAIVRSTIDLAHDLGVTVTAEGIETEGTYEMLREFGCDTAQGFLLSPPLDAAATGDWLLRRTGAGGDPGAEIIPLRQRPAGDTMSEPAQ